MNEIVLNDIRLSKHTIRGLFFLIIGLSMLVAFDLAATTSGSLTGLATFSAQDAETAACGFINENTNLTANVLNNGTCFTFNASGVYLDCRGFSIIYGLDGSSDSLGIVARGLSNITVRNCIIQDANASGARGVGINLTSVQNATISGNIILTNGTSSNYGISAVSGSGSLISGNSIVTQGSSDDNLGINLVNSQGATITGNNITTNGMIENDAISLANSSLATIIGNIINFSGTTTTDGIELITTDNSTISYNVFLSSTSGSNNDGLDFSLASSRNTISYNNISVAGGTTNFGLRIQSSSNENVFTGNNITTTASSGIAIFITSVNGSAFIQTVLSNPTSWIETNANTQNNFTDTTFSTGFGRVRLQNTFNISGASTVTRTRLNISQNRTFLNSTALPFLNASANIFLYNISFGDPQPLVDFDTGSFAQCSSPQCTEVSFSGGIFAFDVASFTAYSSRETPAPPEEPPPSGGPGGGTGPSGGGGGAPPVVETAVTTSVQEGEASFTIEALPGEVRLDTSGAGLAVTGIEFITSQRIRNGRIRLAKQEPDSILDAYSQRFEARDPRFLDPRAVFVHPDSTYDIVVQNIPNAGEIDAKHNFAVSRGFLRELGVGTESLIVLKLTDSGELKRLMPICEPSADSTYQCYFVDRGFSLFTLAAESQPLLCSVCQSGEWSECKGGVQSRAGNICGPHTNFNCQPVVESRSCALQGEPAQPGTQPEPAAPSPPSTTLILIIVVGSFVLISAALVGVGIKGKEK